MWFVSCSFLLVVVVTEVAAGQVSLIVRRRGVVQCVAEPADPGRGSGRRVAGLRAVVTSTDRQRDSREPPPGLTAPEELILYSIDGRDFDPGQEPKTEEKFHNYPVLGKVEITDGGKRAEIAAALKDGMARTDVSRAACFWPRHAIRTVEGGRTTDFVVCFECNQLAVHNGTTRVVKTISREPLSVLNKHLTEANVPLAPG